MCRPAIIDGANSVGDSRLPPTDITLNTFWSNGKVQDLHTQIRELEQCCAGSDYNEIEDRLATLMKSAKYSLRGPEISHLNAVSAWRGQKSENGELFDNLKRFSYPPPERTILGRANLPGLPVFYSSGNLGTMLAELRPDVGDVIQVVGIAPIGNVPSLVVGDMQRLRFSGNVLLDAPANRDAVHNAYSAMNRADQDRFVYVDSFLADRFRDQTELYYPITASFSNIVLREQSHVLWYPSVRAGAGLNLAIPASMFDERFKNIIVKAFEIKADFGHGAYDYDIIYSGWEFGRDGSIEWHDGEAPERIDVQIGTRA